MVTLLLIAMWTIICFVIGHIEFAQYILYVLIGLKGLKSTTAKELFNVDTLNLTFNLDDLLELGSAGILVVASMISYKDFNFEAIIISIVYGLIVYIFFIRTMSKRIFNK